MYPSTNISAYKKLLDAQRATHRQERERSRGKPPTTKYFPSASCRSALSRQDRAPWVEERLIVVIVATLLLSSLNLLSIVANRFIETRVIHLGFFLACAVKESSAEFRLGATY